MRFIDIRMVAVSQFPCMHPVQWAWAYFFKFFAMPTSILTGFVNDFPGRIGFPVLRLSARYEPSLSSKARR